MAILVNELRDILATPIILFFILSNLSAYPWFWVTLLVFLVSALVYKTSTLNVRHAVEVLFDKVNSAPPYFVLELSLWLHHWTVQVVEVLDHIIFCLSSDLNATRASLERLPDIIAKLAIADDKLAMKDVETKAAIADRGAAIARADASANEKQALLARIKELESTNGTLSNKLKMSEMNAVCLEEQVSMKTESQNEILEDMDKLEDELKAMKTKLHTSEMNVKCLETQIAVKTGSQNEILGDMDKLEHNLKTTKSEVVDLKVKLHNSEVNVMSLEQQIAIKTESQNEILDGMDQLEDELNTTKAKLQETAAQKSAIERDLLELRELAANQVAQTSGREACDKRILAQKTAEIAQLKEQLAEAVRTEPPLASELTFHPGRPAVSVPVPPRTPQLNTPPTSPRSSLLFGSARVSFAKKANISPSSSRFGLSSIRISSRRGSVGDSPKKASSVRRGRSSASPSKTDKA